MKWSQSAGRGRLAPRVFVALVVAILVSMHSAKSVGEDAPRVGNFIFPASDDAVIVLDGEVKEGATIDFIQAMRLRPNADTLLLSSSGGLVDEALLIAREVAQRKMATVVPSGAGCYSACAYIFFAGASRTVKGELGVHQIYGDGVDASGAQLVLSDVLDALAEYGVPQQVISAMLRTRPGEIYVLSAAELASLERPAPIGEADSAVDPDADRRRQAEMLVPLIWKCMYLPKGALEEGATALIGVEIIGGYVVGDPKVLKQPTTQAERAMLKAGLAAVRLCNPFPADITVSVNITFDPRDLDQ